MELRQLKYFVAIAEEMHFNRAAARLHISQPAISRAVKDLEGELGVALLARNGHKSAGITPAGKHFLVCARSILRQTVKTSEKMKHFKQSGDEKLTIGVSFFESFLSGTTMSAILSFEAKHPDIELEILELPPLDIVEALRSRRIDVGFLGPAWEKLKMEFKTIPILKYFMAIAMPCTHPLAAHKNLKLSDFSGENFIVPSKKIYPGPYEALFQFCQKAGFTPSIRHQSDSFSAMLALIGAGKGISLIPEKFIQWPHSNTVCFVKLSNPPLVLHTTAAYRKASCQIITNLVNAVSEHSLRITKGIC